MARIKCNGYVVGDDAGPLYAKYGYSVIYPAAVRQAIADNPSGEELVLEINSGGGSVYSGFEIYSILRSATCRTVAEVQSLAGSAASTIACGCDKVMMSPVGQMMIHDPATITVGSIRDHKESLQALSAIKESILNGYEGRCGGKCTRDKLRDLMSKETWLPAQEAVSLGLADGILYDDDGTDPALVVNAAQEGFRAYANSCGGLPPIEELQAREAAENRDPAGEAPADDSDDWKAQAALDVARNRYI